MSKRSSKNSRAKKPSKFNNLVVKSVVRRPTIKTRVQTLHNYLSPLSSRPPRIRRVAKVYNPPRVNKPENLRPHYAVNYEQMRGISIKTPVCLARKIKREVLHAKGVAGSRVSKPTFTEKSKVRC